MATGRASGVPAGSEAQEAVAWVERHLRLAGLYDARRDRRRYRPLELLQPREVALLVNFLRRRVELLDMRRAALGSLYEPMSAATKRAGLAAVDRLLAHREERVELASAQAKQMQSDRAIVEWDRAIRAQLASEGLEESRIPTLALPFDDDERERDMAYRSRYAELVRRFLSTYEAPFSGKWLWVLKTQAGSWNEKVWNSVGLPGELQRIYR